MGEFVDAIASRYSDVYGSTHRDWNAETLNAVERYNSTLSPPVSTHSTSSYCEVSNLRPALAVSERKSSSL
jgi:hypothetical protein